MPCRGDVWGAVVSTGFSDPRVRELYDLKRTNVLLERFICSIFRTAETHDQLEELLKVYPWTEASVSRTDMEDWWKRHKVEDDARIEREKESMKKEQLKKDALSKLSKEEKEALGLK